jgi:molybdenum-dependent DNA-binding transcriptional regulator ModE
MPSYTAKQIIQALEETKGMKTLAAKKLGCSYNTVQRYINEYPTVKEAYEQAHNTMGDAVELKLYDKAMSGDTTAMIFMLKTKFKSRGYVERQEVTGQDGSALKIEIEYVGNDDTDTQDFA